MDVSGQLQEVPLLSVVQVLAHTQQSGVLTVSGDAVQGTVLFLEGHIVCAHSSSTLNLLVKAAKEQDTRSKAAYRRIQALTTLMELLDLEDGVFRFQRTAEPVRELDGVEMSSFYAAVPMNTGDLLLILARTRDKEDTPPSPASAKKPLGQPRLHPRYSPTVITAELTQAASTMTGYLTNLSLGGAFFHGEELPGDQSVCELRLNLPGELGVCQATARVAWVQKQSKNAIRGVGLAFDKMPADSRTRLSTYLEHFRQLATEVASED